jgi:hypothetical protein
MKIALRILLGLVLLALAALGVGLIFMDSIVKGVVQKGATHATGVPTTLNSADASLFSGNLALDELTVANPDGFRPEPFLHLGAIKAHWQNGTIFSDELVIDELAIDKIVINLERAKGRTNLGVILDNLEKLSPKDDKKPAPGDGSKRTLIVKSIVIRDVKAALHLSEVPISSNSMTVEIPRIDVRDFKSNGTTSENVAKLTGVVLQAIAEGTMNGGKGILPKEMLDEINGSLKGLEKQAKDVFKDVEDTIDLFKKIKK